MQYELLALYAGEMLVLLTFYRMFPKREYDIDQAPSTSLIIAVSTARLILSFALLAAVTGTPSNNFEILYLIGLSGIAAFITAVLMASREHYYVLLLLGAAADIAAYYIFKFG